MPLLNRVTISASAITHNIKTLRSLIGQKVILSVAVKANAYGHDLIEYSRIALKAGADWLCVNALFEAEILRASGIKAPIYIMGYVMKKDLERAVALGCRIVAYNKETVKELGKAAKKLNKIARIHIKLETGNNRQGVPLDEILNFVRYAQSFPKIEIEGIATHFANIEDISADDLVRTEAELKSGCVKKIKIGSFPAYQLKNFKNAIAELEANGIHIPLRHSANSAATMIFPETHFNMVRAGISAYGMWPSEEVKVAMHNMNRKIKLTPVLGWKTRIAQIKEVPGGAHIGYGCTFRANKKMRIAILPVGYYDGFDRGFSSKGHVLIHGKEAQICGRVCMNIIMVDVTKIPDAKIEDTVTLLGKDGKKEISAEFLAGLLGTINYEITTRINEKIPRVVVT